MRAWREGLSGVIELPDGRTVRGSSRRRARDLQFEADLVIYLQRRKPRRPATDYRWIAWPDFRIPRDSAQALVILRDAHERAGHERVLLCCTGGTGRTGTALAVMALLAGVDAEEVVPWIRERYQPRAVETRGQRAWLQGIAAQLSH